MDPKRFAGLISLRKPLKRPAAPPQHLDAIEKLHRLSGEMTRYTGWYFRYSYTFGYPGRITRSLCVITEQDGRYLWKNIEVGVDPQQVRARFLGKHEGFAFHLGHRIHIIEHDVLSASSIRQLMLYPSYAPRPGHLRGVQTGGSKRRGRKPAASAVVLTFLGEQIDMRRALAQCGIFEPHEIDDWIKRLIENQIDLGEWVFEIDEI
ncbi:hypothetical protein [Citreicella sp. C3M06]|uniref:hypothetical protein n=1 Tax=Citreicella sp. C3M06 TaxID=2841564 RepID=UPI002091D1FB|nr:hypothetical protein [Citreicella sp. C3M06]